MSALLVFTCPTTGREIPVGVLQGEEALETLPDRKVEVACLECGHMHTWRIGEGRLAMTDEEPPPFGER